MSGPQSEASIRSH